MTEMKRKVSRDDLIILIHAKMLSLVWIERDWDSFILQLI